MIAIVDYGAGNVVSVRKALTHLGMQAELTIDPGEIRRASRIVLPGVGNFSALGRVSGLRSVLLEAIDKGKPFLGICLGMQWLFESSSEAPAVPGAGLLPGQIYKFPVSVKSPHVGWNNVQVVNSSRLMRGADGSHFYFTHSYRLPQAANSAAVSEYGGPFVAAVEKDNIFGVQFHPEKSGAFGLRVLRNFCELPS